MGSSQKVLLESYLVGMPANDLADLDVEMEHDEENEKERGGQQRHIALGQGSDNAAGSMVVKAVPAQDGEQPQAEGDPPSTRQHGVDAEHRPLRVVGEGIVEGEVAIDRDGQQATHGGGEGGDEEAHRQQADRLGVDHVLENEVEDEAEAGQEVSRGQAADQHEHGAAQGGRVADDGHHQGVLAGDGGA